MMRAPRRSSGVASVKGHQRGQALILGLFVLLAGLAALFFFFNVGQLSREKTKLVSTADAVAYSAGVVHARGLNFMAYSNRALMANEVLVAQLVSLSSWTAYLESWGDNLPEVHNECVQAANGNYWAAAASQLKYGPDYLVGCAALYWAHTSGGVQVANRMMQSTVPVLIQAIEAQKTIIQAAQHTVNRGLVIDRHLVMSQVADANYTADGHVSVDLLSPSLPDDWSRMSNGRGGGTTPFVRLYESGERTRFREVTIEAANTDPFVRERRWTSRSLLPEPSCLPFNWRHNEVRRRGGTVLLGFDEWQAVDTQSYHANYRGKRPWNCRRSEAATGMGGEQAFQQDQRPGAESFGRSRNDNPRAHARAVNTSSGDGMNYRGLPDYFDLNQVWLQDRRAEEPRLLHGVRITRSRTDLRTTDGTTGQIRSDPQSRIGAYQTEAAGGQMTAVSASEVFFDRPLDSSRPRAQQQDNIFGARSGRPRELGSLFNPYWQVRLAPSNTAGEWLRQGVTP
ncbi:MAG TPA: pilus assembly protein TadG-related protein [Hydrogenophaga sp.]|uniref:pilus assembly protein TadG-related protein n=1 Tax=Hydrogenophaga sp. TaxID=1904254 RepID=UPI002CC8FE53|nr:pilus assembly protein TadG-related protein [Hydrogenophaga sp.]HMN91734.1 pilus assembly protein TadG-related protein [Hydrogenophaga sp.]HMP10549.1 pilus assembly protein TadG-related protein [Hydrogenophaga sp.]